MITVRIQHEDFDPGEESVALSAGRVDIGALAAFVGLVRADGGLSALQVEHYPRMSEKEIGRHVESAERRWPLLGVTVIHRTGTLAPGERIVLVAVAAAHRDAAFRASEFLIDYLKTRAPFWKKEIRGKHARWVEAKDADADAANSWRRDCGTAPDAARPHHNPASALR